MKEYLHLLSLSTECRGLRAEWEQLLYSVLSPQSSALFVHQGARADETHGQLPELFERHRADVAPRALADGDLALFHLAVAADEHERNLLQLRVPDLRADLVAARVGLDPQSHFAESACYVFRVLVDAVGDRQHRHLHRREPEGERARVLLDEDAEES